MKFSKFGRLTMATAVSLMLGFGLTSCYLGTVDFLYTTTSKNNPGNIAVYRVDYQSGTLTPLQTPVYPSGGRNPVAAITSPNSKNLYVVNHDDNTVVQFAIGTDGKLYPQHTYNTPGTFPISLAINSAGTFLYVVDNFQPGFTDSVPGAGAVVVFPVAADGALGTPVVNTAITPNVSYFPVGNTPTAVAVLPTGTSVYVVNKADATISAFNTSSSGALTLVATVPAGTAPNALAIDPTSRFVYVTDSAANQLIGYAVQPSGTLNTVNNNGPFAAGNFPDAVTVDPRGTYVYVANYNDNSIGAYAIDLSTGAPARVASSPSFATGTGPTCVIVEPSLGRYVYTSNFLDNTVSGFELNIHSGGLTPIQNTPYPIPGGAGQPTCIAAITHGNHSLQHVQP